MQYEISSGRYRAVITEVGATCRSLVVDGAEWLWTFSADQVAQGSQGKQLIPWPNRIRDGRYSFGEVDYQLPISEVPRHTALHGLNEGFSWRLVSHTGAEVVQQHTFHPEAGWPGTLTVSITHSLTDDGLRVEVHVINDGAAPLPYGYGVHPYFAFDTPGEVMLEVPFNEELRVDEDRLLPIALVPTTKGKDFRTARALGQTVFDTAFTASTDPDWRVRLVGPQYTVEVWAGEALPWVQVYTRPERDTIAVEPMTCGPDAFNPGPTHDSLIVLSPGDSHTATWGVRAG